VGPNLSGMAVAALFGVSPTIAVLINNGSAIAAEMNGFRPLMGPPGWREFKAQQLAIAEAAKQARILGAPATSAITIFSADGGLGQPESAKIGVPTNGGNGNGHAHGHTVPANGAEAMLGGNGSSGGNGNGHGHPAPDHATEAMLGGNGSNGGNGNGHDHPAPAKRATTARRKNGSNGKRGNGNGHEPAEVNLAEGVTLEAVQTTS